LIGALATVNLRLYLQGYAAMPFPDGGSGGSGLLLQVLSERILHGPARNRTAACHAVQCSGGSGVKRTFIVEAETSKHRCITVHVTS